MGMSLHRLCYWVTALEKRIQAWFWHSLRAHTPHLLPLDTFASVRNVLVQYACNAHTLISDNCVIFPSGCTHLLLNKCALEQGPPMQWNTRRSLLVSSSRLLFWFASDSLFVKLKQNSETTVQCNVWMFTSGGRCLGATPVSQDIIWCNKMTSDAPEEWHSLSLWCTCKPERRLDLEMWREQALNCDFISSLNQEALIFKGWNIFERGLHQSTKWPKEAAFGNITSRW